MTTCLVDAGHSSVIPTHTPLLAHEVCHHLHPNLQGHQKRGGGSNFPNHHCSTIPNRPLPSCAPRRSWVMSRRVSRPRPCGWMHRGGRALTTLCWHAIKRVLRELGSGGSSEGSSRCTDSICHADNIVMRNGRVGQCPKQLRAPCDPSCTRLEQLARQLARQLGRQLSIEC